MKILLRNILALLAGIVAGAVLMSLVQMASMKLYPPPPDLDFKDPAAMKQYAAGLPVGAFLMVLLSYALGFTTGIFLATRLSVAAHARQGALVAAFFAAASLMNLRAIPHPVWFWVANFVVLLLAAWTGLRFGLPKPDAAART